MKGHAIFKREIISRIQIMIFKNLHLQNRSRPISTKLGRKNIFVKEIHIYLNEGPELLSKGDNSENALLTNENNSSDSM